MQIPDWLKSSIRKTTLISTLLWFLVWVVGYINFILSPIRHGYQGFPWFKESYGFSSFLNSMSQTWDTNFFSRIATVGYNSGADHTGNLDYSFAFFPLYSLVVKLVSNVLPINFTLLIVSLVCSVLLGVIIHNTIKRLGWKEEYWFIGLIAPGSLFLFLPYTESLYLIFMLVAIGIIFSYKRESRYQYLWLLLLGMSGILTRSAALILAVSLLIVTLLVNKLKDRAQFIRSVAYGSGVVLGLFFWSLYNQINTGNWRTFLDVQAYWGRITSGGMFFDPFVRAIQESLSGNPSLSLLYFIGLVVLFFLAWRWRIKDVNYKSIYWVSLLYTGGILFASVSQNTLQSVNRYAYATPLFLLLLSQLINQSPFVKKHIKLLVFLSVLLLVFSGALFFRHVWVG